MHFTLRSGAARLHHQCQRVWVEVEERGESSLGRLLESEAKREWKATTIIIRVFLLFSKSNSTTTNSPYETIGHQILQTLRHRTRFRPHAATTFPFDHSVFQILILSGRRLARTSEAAKSNAVVVVRLSNGWKDSAGLLGQRVRHRGNL
jgi:hypothetical protein